MNERVTSLLAKGLAGGLTPAETEELAGLLNAPILGPVEDQPAGFVSTHVFTQSDLAARLRKIDWFSHCGDPLSCELSMPVEQVGSWSAALESCADAVWEDVQLEAQNQLTLWLHQHDRDNFQNWNKVVLENKRLLKQLAEAAWIPYQQSHALDSMFVRCIEWDVLGALMENSYMASNHRCSFFLELLSVYEAGHFPCGWRGKWPQGNLVVY